MVTQSSDFVLSVLQAPLQSRIAVELKRALAEGCVGKHSDRRYCELEYSDLIRWRSVFGTLSLPECA